MTALLAFLRVAWPYLAAFGAGAMSSAWVVHKADSVPYARLQTTLASQQAQYAAEREKDALEASDALQAQVKHRLDTEANNAKVIDELTKQRDSAAADADLSKRLLLAARQNAPSHVSVPETGGGPGTPPAGPADSGPNLGETLAAAIGECRHNADQLDALIAEISPQL